MPPTRLPFEKEIYALEDMLAQLEADAGTPGSSDEIRRIRASMGFFRDRRPDLYGPLTK